MRKAFVYRQMLAEIKACTYARSLPDTTGIFKGNARKNGLEDAHVFCGRRCRPRPIGDRRSRATPPGPVLQGGACGMNDDPGCVECPALKNLSFPTSFIIQLPPGTTMNGLSRSQIQCGFVSPSISRSCVFKLCLAQLEVISPCMPIAYGTILYPRY
jgi:hypothetical protein